MFLIMIARSSFGVHFDFSFRFYSGIHFLHWINVLEGRDLYEYAHFDKGNEIVSAYEHFVVSK